MKIKSLFSGILALAISVSMMSFSAFAAESSDPAVDSTNKVVTVSNEDQFMSISNYSNSNSDSKVYPRTFSGWTVVIANDLNMTGKTWKPLVNFYGDMQGSVKADQTTTTISHLTVNTSEKAGLCANSANGKFSNLTIADSNITSRGKYAGAFSGNGFTSDFENCDVKNTTIKGNRFVGGITGSSYGDITYCDVEDCQITCNVSDIILNIIGLGDNFGGIVGLLCEGNMTVSDCTVTDTTITGYRQVGGIAGAALYGDTIMNCDVLGNTTITATAKKGHSDRSTPCAGGIVGQFASQQAGHPITVIENTIGANVTVNALVAGWAVGDADSRLNGSTYDVSSNTYNGSQTINQIGDPTPYIVD